MGNFERAIIQASVEDVIRILEDAPVRGHFIPYPTIAEVLNRVAIAHLSIEKAVKFLIREAKGDIVKDHHLGKRFRELKEHDSASAEFLEDVFVAARSHYGIDHESKGMKHFRRLETYLKTTASDDAFNNDKGIRYWELYPTLENALLRQVHLSIHMELLYGLHEILIEPDRDKETVEARVERAVETAMFPNGGMSYSLAMAGESTAKMYREWLNQFCTLREALADAVKGDFNLGNELAATTARSAYETLSDAKDPAVSHFARTLDILPPQPRDVIPDVEWLDGNRRQRGRVSTPSGVDLGFIEQGPHGLWYNRSHPSRANWNVSKGKKTEGCHLLSRSTADQANQSNVRRCGLISQNCREGSRRLQGNPKKLPYSGRRQLPWRSKSLQGQLLG